MLLLVVKFYHNPFYFMQAHVEPHVPTLHLHIHTYTHTLLSIPMYMHTRTHTLSLLYYFPFIPLHVLHSLWKCRHTSDLYLDDRPTQTCMHDNMSMLQWFPWPWKVQCPQSVM